MKKTTIILSLLLLMILRGNAQQYSFAGYSIGDGLSQSVVNCIFQDSEGYIWLGTQNGLNKFNGYTFEVFTYNPNDTNSITNNWIYSIAEDEQGNLWIGTKSGLVKYNRKTSQFKRIIYRTPYPAAVTDCVYDVKRSRNGNLLINTPPVLTVCNPKTLEFSHYISPLAFDGSIKDHNIPLLEDRDDNIWIASTKGLAAFNPKTNKFRLFGYDPLKPESISGDIITALYQDENGNLWVGTSEGLNRLKEDGTGFDHFYHESGQAFSLSNNFIRAIIADKSGNIWVATEGGGLNRMRQNPDKKPIFDSFSGTNSGLNHNIILSLAIDQSDNLWIGTLSGINKTDLKKRNFNLYRNSDSPYSVDLLGNVIASVYEDEKKIVWIGNWGQGLNLFDRITGKVEHYASNLAGKFHIPNDFVHCIYEDDLHNIWLGTRDGLLIFDKQQRRFNRPKGNGISAFNGLRINMMIQDHHQAFWVATNDGLYRMQRNGIQPEHYSAEAEGDHKISSNLVYAVLEDGNGAIWVGTINGLDVIDPKGNEIKHFTKENHSISDNFITALCQDQQGNIWIGTNTYVNRFSTKQGTFSYYDRNQGFPSNLVYSILEDNNHVMWFATGNGLCRFDEQSGTFRAFTIEDGLQSPEFNLRASFRSKSGELFFGGMNGLNSFYPDSLRNNPNIPDIAYTATYSTFNGVRKNIHPDDEGYIHLGHKENTFTIEFAALEFTNPLKNRYAYKLEGTDGGWIDIGTRNFVSFTNLSPGDYKLWVKACNNDGVWNENGANMIIIIHPPWWKSTLAYVAYLFLIVFLIYLYIKMRERHYVRERRILEEKVTLRTQLIESQKSEILAKNAELKELNTAKDKFFSIIAHDLRNPFNTIIGLADILLITLDNITPEKLQKSLESIKTSSQQAHELLENLLLWARSHTGTLSFRPELLDLKALVNAGVELISVQAGRKSITIIRDFGECRPINGDVNMIGTILRNLLVNALKFTPRNGSITVGISEVKDFCVLRVRDSGIGIASDKIDHLFNIDTPNKTKGTEQEPGSGLGLILCRELIEKHGGSIHVESEAGKGSEFRVLIPFGKNDALPSE